jgi:hypothetical protein
MLSVSEFKHIFYMYFKGESKASIIYEKLLPYIKCYLVGEEIMDKVP